MYLVADDFKKPWLFVRDVPLGFLHKPIHDTLRMFDRSPGTDPKTTPYFKALGTHSSLKYRMRTGKNRVQLTQYLRTLRADIAKNGIKVAPTIHIRGDGKIQIGDGYHRLICADYIGYKRAMPVRVISVGPNFKAIEKIMLKLGGGKAYTYHPLRDALYHPYFRNWRAWRPDTPARYRSILAKLGGAKTVLEIGACEGYVAINLAVKGYDVTAIEINPNRATVLGFFANLRGVKVPVAVEDWKKYCARTEKEFDAAIFLSTFHHQVIHHGLEEFKKLGLIKAKKLFFEIACNREPKMAKFPTLSNNEIIKRVLANTKFTRWEKVYTAQRDIFMFW